ncbi:MAG TPA: response regulator transcription factor, partial [Alphaproteobacteria bacterium]|nr:response regulator transcription factor [Alphaproteobacteria bacterium]
MAKMRVLLVDDHALFRDGLASLMRAWDMEVVGQASNGMEAVELTRKLHPDLVLMDIHMPVMDGLTATRIIKAEMPEVQVVMLTISDAEESLFEAVKAGAQGYILKNVPGDEFARLLSNLANGEPAMSRGLAQRLLQEFARGPRAVRERSEEEQLTEREREVLQKVAEGLTNREIGEQLFISEDTVKYHLKNIMQKLHLRNRAEVVAWALRR